MNDILNLVDVVFFQVGATRLEREIEDDDNGPEPGTFNTNWGLKTRHDGREFGVRIRAELETEFGEIVVDVAAEYEATDAFDLPEREVITEYVNNISLMQLFPYVRETVTTLGAKVFGEALVMPTFQRGEIEFTL